MAEPARMQLDLEPKVGLAQSETASGRVSLLPGGGNSGVPPEILVRLAVLERRAEESDKRLARIEAPLERLQEQMTRALAKLDELPTRKEFTPLQTELGRIGGKVDSLPTWLQIIGLAGLISTVAAGLGNLDRIISAIRAPTPTITAGPTPPPASASGKQP